MNRRRFAARLVGLLGAVGVLPLSAMAVAKTRDENEAFVVVTLTPYTKEFIEQEVAQTRWSPMTRPADIALDAVAGLVRSGYVPKDAIGKVIKITVSVSEPLS